MTAPERVLLSPAQARAELEDERRHELLMERAREASTAIESAVEPEPFLEDDLGRMAWALAELTPSQLGEASRALREAAEAVPAPGAPERAFAQAAARIVEASMMWPPGEGAGEAEKRMLESLSGMDGEALARTKGQLRDASRLVAEILVA